MTIKDWHTLRKWRVTDDGNGDILDGTEVVTLWRPAEGVESPYSDCHHIEAVKAHERERGDEG